MQGAVQDRQIGAARRQAGVIGLLLHPVRGFHLGSAPARSKSLPKGYPTISWNQVFAAVDRLNREVTLTLQRPDSLDYLPSLAPRRSAEVLHVTPV